MKVDAMMTQAWVRIIDDVLASGSYPTTFSTRKLKAFRSALQSQPMIDARKMFSEHYQSLPSAAAKEIYQVTAFGKRWIYESDKPQETLTSETLLDFIKTQESLDEVWGPKSKRAELVLESARALNEAILGKYDLEEHKALCRFGKKAAFNLKAGEAYLHNRCPQMSATRRQMLKFGDWLMEDDHLRHCLTTQPGPKALTSYLNLTIVPKSYKSGRAIVPDTILGGYISGGFGELIRRRLAVNAGLDIRKKQAEHRRVACKASVTAHLATVDMSKASDRISWPLLQRILPPDWLQVIDADRIHQVLVKDEDLGFAYPQGVRSPENDATLIKVVSPLLMGKGYTFPLQTLVFFSLLLAIADLLHIGHKYISVYGDDLIYPVELHKYVVAVFSELGLVLNLDKSYAETKKGTLYRKTGVFRESCGGDYINGVDVRPYMPEGQSGKYNDHCSSLEYAALCYTVVNGLLSRWEWWEVRKTLRYLLIEAHNCLGKILVVSPAAGVKSGLRWSEDVFVWLHEIDEHFVIEAPKHLRVERDDGSYEDVVETYGIAEQGEYAPVPDDETIYMWDSLRRKALAEEDEEDPSVISHGSLKRRGEIAVVREHWDRDEVEVLYRRTKNVWLTKDGQVFDARPAGVPARKIVLEVPCVRAKGSNRVRMEIQRKRLPATFWLTTPTT